MGRPTGPNSFLWHAAATPPRQVEANPAAPVVDDVAAAAAAVAAVLLRVVIVAAASIACVLDMFSASFPLSAMQKQQ